MTKRINIIITVFLAMVMLSSVSYAAGEKIGVVNMKRAFYEYEKTKKFESELAEVTKKLGEDRKGMVDDLTKLRGEMELASGNAKSKKKIEIDKRLAQLAEFDRESRRQVMAKKNNMFKEVIDEINSVITGIGKKGNYDYILDEQSVRYFKDNYDITDEVLTKLNK